MEPLNIAIKDLSLDTVVSAEGYDPITLADAIVSAAVAKLTHEDEWRDTYGALKKRVAQIRDEEIRALVKAEIETAMAEPVQETNQWGEALGKPTTLRALMVAEAEKFFTEKRGTDNYNREPRMTGAERVVAQLVQAELVKEMAAIFAAEKAKVTEAVQGRAAELLAQAVKDGLRK